MGEVNFAIGVAVPGGFGTSTASGVVELSHALNSIAPQAAIIIGCFIFIVVFDGPFSPCSLTAKSGLGKAHQLFGEQLPRLLDELNTVLAT